jgi:hypothetical protein
MDHTDQINLGDPVIRHALYEAGKWSRLIAIISGVLLGLFAVGIAIAFILVLAFPEIMDEALNEAFLDNPMLASMSPVYLGVMYVATVAIGIYVSIKLFQFGKLLKGNGPLQQLSNSEINLAFGHLLNTLKVYAVFSVVSLLGNLVMMLL